MRRPSLALGPHRGLQQSFGLLKALVQWRQPLGPKHAHAVHQHLERYGGRHARASQRVGHGRPSAVVVHGRRLLVFRLLRPVDRRTALGRQVVAERQRDDGHDHRAGHQLRRIRRNRAQRRNEKHCEALMKYHVVSSG